MENAVEKFKTSMFLLSAVSVLTLQPQIKDD
jgi:hypothetical protein